MKKVLKIKTTEDWLKILNEHEDWKALVIGDEPREKYNFFHPRLKLIGWVPHFKTLKF